MNRRVRHRRSGGSHLPADDAALRQVAGLKPRVIVQVPVLTPGLSSLWVGLVTPVPAGLASPLVESLRNEVVCSEHDIAGTSRPARRAADPRRGHQHGPAVHPRGRGLHPLDLGRDARRAQRPAADRPVVGRRIPVRRRAQQRRARLARGAVAGDRGHRRRDRVVLLPGRLGRPRAARPAGRRGGTAPRPPRPPASAGRRRPGLLAGRGDRAGQTAAAARGDEAAGPGLAGTVRGPGLRRDDDLQPAGDLPAARARRSCLLAVHLAVPRHRLRRHAAEHHRRREQAERAGDTPRPYLA